MKCINSEIIRLYKNEHLSCSDISSIDGRSEATIYKILLDQKVSIRNKSDANKLFPDDILIILYNMAMSFRQIGKLLGIHPTTISKRFNKIHFPIRSSKSSRSIKYSNEEFRKYFYNPVFINQLRQLA